jgi:hypothetical protein
MPFHELLYNAGNLVILPFWGLMIFAPHWPVSQRIMRTWWPVILMAALYVVGIIYSLFAGNMDTAQLSFDVNGIAALMGNPAGAAAVWMHLLAFDLFAGRWAYLDSRGHDLPGWLASPALFLILMLGPFGMLVYLAGRWWWLRRT